MYQVFGWPAGARSFRIQFFDMMRNTTVEVSASHTQNRIAYVSEDRVPGLLAVTPIYTLGEGAPYTFPINNPPSLSHIRWMVRQALNDIEEVENVDVQYPSEAKFSDSEINAQILEAIGLVNRYVRRPVIIESRLSTIRPETIRKLVDVTSFSLQLPETSEWIEISRYSRRRSRTNGRESAWEILNGELRLYGTFPTNARIEIRGEVQYGVPLNDFDELEIDPIDYDILSLYAQGKCMLRVAGQSAQLDRWKEEGRRNDNPVTPIARLLLTEAENRLATRQGPRTARRYIE